MIRHVVMFRRQEDLTDEAVSAAFVDNIHIMSGIEGVSNLDFGPVVASQRHGYTHALVCDITDRAALAAYGPHPLHQQFAAITRPMMAEVMVIDIEL